jgi:Cys-tRNA(Pro)/Cys-tRNA(Cys) deacylase
MTPACNLLKKLKIPFSIHEYEHDPACTNFGLEAAEKLNLPMGYIFKTLLITDEKQFFVAIIPVTHTMSLKKAAHAFGLKKVRMAKPDEAERITGYLVGGISPIGQKKLLKTTLDTSAKSLEKVYVSGGKRGLDIGLVPDDLLRAIHGADFFDLIDES